MHGAYSSGFDFVKGVYFDAGLPGLLAEQGYDVWLGNSRGTPYSNYNVKDGTWSSERERWDFDWSDMGQYDIPAFVDKIIEVTEKPKVTLMGYSKGGAQIFYALAKNHDRYVDKVHRFVGLSPCYIKRVSTSYDQEKWKFLGFYEQDINYFSNGESFGSQLYLTQIGLARQF